MRPCISLLFLVILSCIVPASALLQPPVANFTMENQGSPLTPVQFTDTSTGNPVSWYWDFGDGKHSTLQNPDHVFTSMGGGIHSVTLKVTNAAGSNISAPKTIYMADWTPVYTQAAPKQITAPYTITRSGMYELSSDCTGSATSGDCTITITDRFVTLDGKGHSLNGGGIIVKKPDEVWLNAITLRNLRIEGGTTGILVSGIYDATISNVTVVKTVRDGMRIEESENVRVENSAFVKNVDNTGNRVYENTYQGGIVLTGTDDVSITGCSFEDHTNAIVLLNTTDTTISSNYFHNDKDIGIYSAERTKIFNNYISVVKGVDGTNSNTLNTTLQDGQNIIGGNKLGGNYWYKDDGTGYSQICVDDNHSGICDKPYEADYFPLCGAVGSGKPAYPVITPKAVHTIPTGDVYSQSSQTPTPYKPVTTSTRASLPFSCAILAILFGALVTCLRR
ncbi:MAG: NosD domain-containing protein [Methanoregula sp.]|nr:NosD domain-containing protein [Methanoregula sp.]